MSHDELHDVIAALSSLEPGEGERPMPASQALARVRARARQQAASASSPAFGHSLFKEMPSMFKRKFAFATLLLLLVAAAFALPAVRAAASDFLGLFRVEKFAPITISPQQIALLESLAEEGLSPGQFELTSEPGAPQYFPSLAQAEQQMGHRLARPRLLDRPFEVYVSAGGAGHLVIDLAGARAILSATGADPALLPDSLDGGAVNVTIFNSAVMQWPDGTALMQTDSPQVDYPEEVDPVVIGQALLRVLGMNQAEATRLAESIDWTSTLIFPIPEDVASFSEVTVNGASGLALSSLDGSDSALLWQKNGVIYLLSGQMPVRELSRIAGSVR